MQNIIKPCTYIYICIYNIHDIWHIRIFVYYMYIYLISRACTQYYPVTRKRRKKYYRVSAGKKKRKWNDAIFVSAKRDKNSTLLFMHISYPQIKEEKKLATILWPQYEEAYVKYSSTFPFSTCHSKKKKTRTLL